LGVKKYNDFIQKGAESEINTSYILFLIPLFYILPIFMGIIGVFTAWPIAVFSSALLSGVFLYREIKVLDRSINRPADSC
jgi:Na+-driven multidrug efflux pump